MHNQFNFFWKLALLGLVSFVYSKSPTYVTLLKDIETKNVFVTYYSSQCEFSQHFLKLWKKLNVQNLPTVGGGFVSHLIDCVKETDICVEQKVKYYPSIRFHQSGFDRAQIFKGRRSDSALLSFLGKAMLGARSEPTNFEDGGLRDSQLVMPDTKDGVMDLTDTNFDSLTAGGPVFIKFYTDWCPHCKELQPLFPKLAPAAKLLGVSLGQVNCESQMDTCSRQAVPHYPFMALHGLGRRLAVHEAENSIEDWRRFLLLQLQRLREDGAAAAAEGVVENWFSIVRPISLTLDTFDEAAKSTEFLFVKFFAPWCSHCQQLAPVWDQLAHLLTQEFPTRGQFALAKVDCTQEVALCTRHGIRAYPSLLLYRRGHLVDSFGGLRDLTALADFVKSAIGLHSVKPRVEL